jgi:putative FmdB family regulatory protein
VPTYEYVCQSCGTHVEVYQRFSDDPLTECGVCGGPLRKVFHPAGILFKGSGFYVTDSKAGSKTKSDGQRGARGEGAKESKVGGGTSDSGSGSKTTPAKSSPDSGAA